MSGTHSLARSTMTDGFGRRIDTLRLSVTDRCDLRCRYCMSERMHFLPSSERLTVEEMALLADRFVARGVRRIRLSGGEPLVHPGLIDLARRLGRHRATGALDELTLTTNGTRLAECAADLFEAGIRRVNVSLDSLVPATFAAVTRGGRLAVVLEGIAAAREAGLRVKINMVAQRGVNDGEILPMLRWCAANGHDLTLIETMPLGSVDEDRADRFLPLTEAVARIGAAHPLTPLDDRTSGPARYFAVAGLPGLRLGLITPLSNIFCSGCNRMRLSCEGKIYMCLGHDSHVDLKAALRRGGPEALDDELDRALALKPAAHDFAIDSSGMHGMTRRHMNVTGG